LARLVTDPRRHNRLHPLPEMIVMALVAVLCGADGWDDVADFCHVRAAWFERFLSLPRGVPSHDTFGRVSARLDPSQVEDVLRQWMSALNVATGGKLIAVDGKSLRRSFEHAWNAAQTMTHIVSAFAAENRLVLAQLGVLDKENEITAIPRLLAMIDLAAATVTIDAIGCQRDIAEQITDAKGHYVLQVKDNQPTLHAKVRALLTANLLRLNKTTRSIRGQRKRCAWSDEYLFNTLFRGLKADPA
jgi:hypothetical protein